MFRSAVPFYAVAAAALAASQAVLAQEPGDENAPPNPDEAQAENSEPNPDEAASFLNSRQQLQQTFTLKRTINGEVVEEKTETVTLSPGAPYRPTEAGETTLQKMREAFDREVLTRVEAFEEAKLDFTVADVNRDNQMSAEEFAGLVETWRNMEERAEPVLTEEEERQRAFEALFQTEEQTERRQQAALQKFAFMSGAAPTIGRADYIREYLLDFDAMDTDDDTILRAEELQDFRAALRGEGPMPAAMPDAEGAEIPQAE